MGKNGKLKKAMAVGFTLRQEQKATKKRVRSFRRFAKSEQGQEVLQRMAENQAEEEGEKTLDTSDSEDIIMRNNDPVENETSPSL